MAPVQGRDIFTCSQQIPGASIRERGSDNSVGLDLPVPAVRLPWHVSYGYMGHSVTNLSPSLPEATPRTRMRMQDIYFGGAHSKHWRRSRDVGQEGKEASTGHSNEQVTAVGTRGSTLLGTWEEQKSKEEREADLPEG